MPSTSCAGQLTKRSRHIEVHEFAVMDWVERDLLDVIRVETAKNTADAFTKALSKALFHRHFDVIMGKRRPTYSFPYTESRKKLDRQQTKSPTTRVQTIKVLDIWDVWDTLNTQWR